MSRKTIAIYPFNEKRHSLYDSIIETLSDKYDLVYEYPKPEVKQGYLFKLTKIPELRTIYHKHIRELISVNDLKLIFSGNKRKRRDCGNFPYDLIYASNSIPCSDNAYIIDLEVVTALAGYSYSKLDKVKISEEFQKAKCKAIVCWSDFSKKSLTGVIDCSKFVNKIKVIPFAIKSDKIEKKKHKGLNLLFVSSTNNPLDFELKGGIIALEAYSVLIEKYPDVSLTMRTYMPPSIKKKYGKLRGLKLIEQRIDQKELASLFLSSDLLFEPMPGINLMLECMNYKLPIVAFDFGAIPEMVLDKKSGFLVDSSSIFGDKKDVVRFQKELHLNYLKLYNKKADVKLIESFAEKAEILLKDKKIREKMSLETKKLIEKGGKYNLEARNIKILSLVRNSFD